MSTSPPPPPPPLSLVPPPPPYNEDWRKLLDKKEDRTTDDSTPHNAAMYLKFHPDFQVIRWNDYAKKIEVTGGVLAPYAKNPKVLVTVAQDFLAHKHLIPIKSRTDIEQRILLVAQDNTYNPLHDYLRGLVWDKSPRTTEIFTKYFGAGVFTNPAAPTEEELARIAHLRRIGRCWLLGAVERAFAPGCKVDNSVLFEGLQGAKKSSAIQALFGRFYSSTAMTVGDKDSKMIAAKNWAVDLPDSDFLTDKRNKGFLTTQKDTFRPPYGAVVEETDRTCFFIGSVNPDGSGYIDDETGARRPWPVQCGVIDRLALLQDADQILAEAVALREESLTCPDCAASNDKVFDQRPCCAKHRWWLDEEEERASANETSLREKDVPFKLRIHEWWLSMEPSKRPASFSVEDVASMALGIEEERLNDRLMTQIGMAVRKLGFRKIRPVIHGVRHYAYEPSPALAAMVKQAKPARSLYAMLGGKTTPGTK